MDKQEVVRTLDTLTNQEKIGWDDLIKICNVFDEVSKNSSEIAPEMFPYFHKIIENDGYSPDIAPKIADEYLKMQKSVPYQQKLDSVLYLLDKNQRFAFRIIDKDAEIVLELAKHIMNELKTKEPVDVFAYSPILPRLMMIADDKLCLQMMDEVLALENDKKIFTNNTYDALGKMYQKRHPLRDKIFAKITSFDTNAMSAVYKNLTKVLEVDSSKKEACLDFIDANIGLQKNDSGDLSIAYEALAELSRFASNDLKDEINAIFEKGLANPNNDRESKRIAWRLMGKSDELLSRAILGERVPKSASNQFGWRSVADLPADEVCVFFLGGDGTMSEISANGYLSSVENLLKEKGLYGKVGMYGLVYEFGDYMNKHSARLKLMQDKKRKVNPRGRISEDTINPRYVKEVFEKVFLPRISKNDGTQRISTDEASRALRGINVVTHCHGTYTMLKVEDLMSVKMQELGYDKKEIEQIQKQLLVVSHAPYAPLGVSKSTMLSFASAGDFEVEHYNNFHSAIINMKQRKEQIPLSFFPEKQGNLFLAPTMSKEEDNGEHNFSGYDAEQGSLSKEGKAITKMSGNVIANGLRNSLEGFSVLPDVEHLVGCDNEEGRKFFDKITSNGAKMYQRIVVESMRACKSFRGK